MNQQITSGLAAGLVAVSAFAAQSQAAEPAGKQDGFDEIHLVRAALPVASWGLGKSPLFGS